ncbi:unnamed protein product [Sphagnum jensenii]|uniref:WD repeat-containing protein 44 n=1 Tax=Sphagnum jensenii TaxID=128206 RepID=A0ABP1AKQ3_9BRYO
MKNYKRSMKRYKRCTMEWSSRCLLCWGKGEVSDQYDEYHESKEDLTSASSSDSLDDEQQGARGDYNHRKKVQNRPAMTAATISGQERPPLWSSSSNLNSKFAVWKDNPGSIQDRRQRFFQQMGFKNLRGEHRFGHGFGSLSKSVSRPDPEIKDSDAAERLTVGRDITLENDEGSKGAVYRIRDLDSGKEFVVDEFGTDGTLEKFKDVDTGKELTLEEFESSLGLYPVMQELKRREREADRHLGDLNSEQEVQTGHVAVVKKKGWLRNIKGAILPKGSHRDGDDRDASSRGGLRSGSATDENSDSAPTWKKPQRIKVRLHHKSYKQLSELHLGQEIEAHQGAIWTMKFSPDGRYLASAGQDKVVHVWEVIDHPSIADSGKFSQIFDIILFTHCRNHHLVSLLGRGGILENGRSEAVLGYKPGKTSSGKRRSGDLSNKVPYPKLFWLSNKAMCSFRGHTEDVLDLSWSRTQFLLSSSMDKTVRLWHISYEGCLRTFSHNDYVTCIQFNPVDEFYFLSGALDDKVRIWSIADHQVVDWTDLGEMVTAVCYTPDGKRAIVGSYKGTCRYFNTAGNKLQLEAHIDVRNDRKKKARGKKITGLQCMPGNPSKVLVTSNDSRIRVYDDLEMISKYKGLRNVNSQISASFCGNGEVIVSASEDSRVYVWNSGILHPSTKSVWKDRKRSCEEFYCHHVSVAIPWPGGSPGFSLSAPGSETPGRSVRSGSEGFVSPSRDDPHDIHESPSFDENRPIGKSSSRDEILGSQKQSLREGCPAAADAGWGLVIVTGSLGGRITTFQNYGLPVRF